MTLLPLSINLKRLLLENIIVNTDIKILVPLVNQTPEEQALMVVLNHLVAYLDDSEIPIVRVHRELNAGNFNFRSARRERPDIPTQYEFRTTPDFQVKLWLNIYLVMVDPTGGSFVLTPKQTAYLYAEANNPLFTSRLKLYAEHVVSTIKRAADAAYTDARVSRSPGGTGPARRSRRGT